MRSIQYSCYQSTEKETKISCFDRDILVLEVPILAWSLKLLHFFAWLYKHNLFLSLYGPCSCADVLHKGLCETTHVGPHQSWERRGIERSRYYGTYRKFLVHTIILTSRFVALKFNQMHFNPTGIPICISVKPMVVGGDGVGLIIGRPTWLSYVVRDIHTGEKLYECMYRYMSCIYTLDKSSESWVTSCEGLVNYMLHKTWHFFLTFPSQICSHWGNYPFVWLLSKGDSKSDTWPSIILYGAL